MCVSCSCIPLGGMSPHRLLGGEGFPMSGVLPSLWQDKTAYCPFQSTAQQSATLELLTPAPLPFGYGQVFFLGSGWFRQRGNAACGSSLDWGSSPHTSTRFLCPITLVVYETCQYRTDFGTLVTLMSHLYLTRCTGFHKNVDTGFHKSTYTLSR